MARVNHPLTFELYYDGVWNSADLREANGLKVRWGTSTAGSETDHASLEGVLDNLSRWYSPRAVTSPLYGKIGLATPARLTLDGGSPYYLEMASWDPNRSADDKDAWTVIQAGGVLQRIGRGANNIRTALDSSILETAPLAWWPLSDVAGSTSAASGVAGGGPLTVDGSGTVTFAEVDGPALSVGGKFPELIQDDAYGPVLVGPVPAISGTPSQWQISFWFKCYSDPADGTVGEQGYPLDIRIGGSNKNVMGHFWLQGEGRVTFFSDLIDGSTYNLLSPIAFLPITDGIWHNTRVTFEQITGTTYTTKLYIDGVFKRQDTGFTGLIGYPTEVRITGARTFDFTIPVTLSVMGVSVSTTLADHYAAGMGYPGETAADRFSRLCLENDITPTVVGVAADSVAMGPQIPRTLLEEFDEIVRTDDAHIFETRGAIGGLTMVCGNAKLNATPVFTLSYQGDIVPGLKAVIGDAGTRNDVTAAAPDGTTRRVQQLTGPRNVSLPSVDPRGVGRYDTKIDVNPATAAGVADAAGWRVNIGTFDGTWYAVVTADLDAAPGIIASVDALQPGDIIGLSDLPTDEALDTVYLVVLGFEDSVQEYRRTRRIFCVPADPYRVGVISNTTGDTGSTVGHLEAGLSTTNGATAALAATFSVATSGGPLWTTTADDFPFDVLVGGQRVSISSIAGGASPQTFTVQTTGRKVVYPVPAGSDVTIYQPIIPTL